MPEYGEFRSAYGTILGKDASFQTPINKNVTGRIWYTDFAGDIELQCGDYADVAFLKAIYYYNLADYEQSTKCYQLGESMFDGTGFKDKAFAADGDRYSTYKVALWQIANDLARGGQEDIAEKAREILEKMQDKQTGGVYTHYTSDLIPDSQTNVETTSLAILVFDGSLLRPKVEPPTAAMLEQCKELEIEDEKCSERAIITERTRVERPPTTPIKVLANPAMLALFGLLAAGVGGGAAIFYIKTTKGRSLSKK